MTRLLLNMIVKNEAKNLPRMLASVGPHVVGAAITDTGSTDETKQIFADYFAAQGKPCVIQDAPFENFEQARNAALAHARASNGVDWDYILLCDADMELVGGERLAAATLDKHAYALMQTNGVLNYWNVRLLRRDTTFVYRGVTHETLEMPDNPPHAIGGTYYLDHETGANRIEKYQRDIRLLVEDLKTDPENPRSLFYMIQSLEGAGMTERAREFCDYRMKVGGLEEERYWTLLEMARFDEKLGRDPDVIQAEYLRAYQFRPTRAEPLYYLTRFHRARDEWHVALMYAREAANKPFPAEVLQVEAIIYKWIALDEYLTCALKCGAMEEARLAAKRLLKAELPADQVKRIAHNCRIANAKSHPNRRRNTRRA